MDISKMYCRVDSEHFDEFVKWVGEQFGRKASNKAVGFTKSHHNCVVIGAGRHHHDFGVSWCHIDDWYENKGFMEFTGSWTIYNNTKPLSELTDEQAAELFNWWCNGGVLEFFTTHKEWANAKPRFESSRVYRAKQKSERELFIEAALNAANKYDAECDKTFAEAMFKAGFKAPKGGE